MRQLFDLPDVPQPVDGERMRAELDLRIRGRAGAVSCATRLYLRLRSDQARAAVLSLTGDDPRLLAALRRFYSRCSRQDHHYGVKRQRLPLPFRKRMFSLRAKNGLSAAELIKPESGRAALDP